MEDGDGSHVRSCNKQVSLDSKISIINCERTIWRLTDDLLESVDECCKVQAVTHTP
jgi:hypothetical protein